MSDERGGAGDPGRTSPPDSALGDDDAVVSDEQSEVSGRSRRRSVPVPLFVASCVVAVILAVVAVLSLSRPAAEEDRSEDLRLAAGAFAEEFLTLDHTNIDGWKDRVLALSTGGFANEVRKVESGLRELVTSGEVDTTARVTDVFLGVEERGSVEVVVIYDRDLEGADGSRSETDRYLQLTMVRVDGAWLVDNVIDIATASAVGSPDSPSTTEPAAATTTSTAPATSAPTSSSTSESP